MKVLAEKMRNAGVDTIGARLTTACTEALNRHPASLSEAWRYVGASFGHQFLRDVLKDMKLGALPDFPVKPVEQGIVASERLARRDRLREVVRSKFKNSAGVPWSDVGWHELIGLSRDGNEAAALLAAGPASVPNDGRTVGQVLGVKKVDQIIKSVRS